MNNLQKRDELIMEVKSLICNFDIYLELRNVEEMQKRINSFNNLLKIIEISKNKLITKSICRSSSSKQFSIFTDLKKGNIDLYIAKDVIDTITSNLTVTCSSAEEIDNLQQEEWKKLKKNQKLDKIAELIQKIKEEQQEYFDFWQAEYKE